MEGQGQGVVVGSRESVTINYTESFERDGQGKSELNSEEGRRNQNQVFEVSYLDPMSGEFAYRASTAVVDVTAGSVHALASKR